MDKEAIKIIFALILLTCSCFYLGFISYPVHQERLSKITSTYPSDCEYNGSLSDTSYCLNAELLTFFNFNLSNTGIPLNESELKTQGGVCSHYSKWYISQFKKHNVYTKYIIIDTGNTTAHAVAIVSDNNEYCLLDQTSVICYTFEQ